jgi:hypothetical protein
MLSLISLFINAKVKLPSCNDFGEKHSNSSDIDITDMAIQTEETTPVKDDINIYKENRPKNMS